MIIFLNILSALKKITTENLVNLIKRSQETLQFMDLTLLGQVNKTNNLT